MKEKKQLELKSEEMRVLYVAMTRAKEKLLLVATLSKWEDASVAANTMLPEYVRARAKGFLDWIGPAVSRHADYASWQGRPNANGIEDPSSWSFETVYVEQLRQDHVVVDVPQIESTQQVVTEDLKAEVLPIYTAIHLNGRYPSARSTSSELKRRSTASEEERFQTTQVKEEMKKSVYKRPAFMQQGDKKLSTAEIGTALHTTMQHLDFSMESSSQALTDFIQQLANKQLLTVEEAGTVNVSAMQAFLQSELANDCAKPNKCYVKYHLRMV
jgi:ATP-dependent helicase/nuclease subunit A